MDDAVKQGDVVYLKGNQHQKLNVISYNKATGLVSCVWIDIRGAPQGAPFPRLCLDYFIKEPRTGS